MKPESANDDAHRREIYQYYQHLNDYFRNSNANTQDRSNSSRAIKARAKLLKLSSLQFFELCTDISDELRRRTTNHNEQKDEYLLPKSGFHLKRNQARQKLANLSQIRFNDLIDDILFEIKRRNYTEIPDLGINKEINDKYNSNSNNYNITQNISETERTLPFEENASVNNDTPIINSSDLHNNPKDINKNIEQNAQIKDGYNDSLGRNPNGDRVRDNDNDNSNVYENYKQVKDDFNESFEFSKKKDDLNVNELDNMSPNQHDHDLDTNANISIPQRPNLQLPPSQSSIQPSLIIPQKASIDWSSSESENEHEHEHEHEHEIVDDDNSNEGKINKEKDAIVHTNRDSVPSLTQNAFVTGDSIISGNKTPTYEKAILEINEKLDEEDKNRGDDKLIDKTSIGPTETTETIQIDDDDSPLKQKVPPQKNKNDDFDKNADNHILHLPIQSTDESTDDNNSNDKENILHLNKELDRDNASNNSPNVIRSSINNTSHLQKELIKLNGQIGDLSIENEQLKQKLSEFELKQKLDAEKAIDIELNGLNNSSTLTKGGNNSALLSPDSLQKFIDNNDGIIPFNLVTELHNTMNETFVFISNNDAENGSVYANKNFGTHLFGLINSVTSTISEILSLLKSCKLEIKDKIMLLRASLSHAITTTRYYALYHNLLPKLIMFSALSEVNFIICDLIKLVKIKLSENGKTFVVRKNSSLKDVNEIEVPMTPMIDRAEKSNNPFSNTLSNLQYSSTSSTDDSHIEESPVKPLKIIQKVSNSPLSKPTGVRSSSRIPSGTGLVSLMVDPKSLKSDKSLLRLSTPSSTSNDEINEFPKKRQTLKSEKDESSNRNISLHSLGSQKESAQENYVGSEEKEEVKSIEDSSIDNKIDLPFSEFSSVLEKANRSVNKGIANAVKREDSSKNVNAFEDKNPTTEESNNVSLNNKKPSLKSMLISYNSDKTHNDEIAVTPKNNKEYPTTHVQHSEKGASFPDSKSADFKIGYSFDGNTEASLTTSDDNKNEKDFIVSDRSTTENKSQIGIAEIKKEVNMDVAPHGNTTEIENIGLKKEGDGIISSHENNIGIKTIGLEKEVGKSIAPRETNTETKTIGFKDENDNRFSHNENKTRNENVDVSEEINHIIPDEEKVGRLENLIDKNNDVLKDLDTGNHINEVGPTFQIKDDREPIKESQPKSSAFSSFTKKLQNTFSASSNVPDIPVNLAAKTSSTKNIAFVPSLGGIPQNDSLTETSTDKNSSLLKHTLTFDSSTIEIEKEPSVADSNKSTALINSVEPSFERETKYKDLNAKELPELIIPVKNEERLNINHSLDNTNMILNERNVTGIHENLRKSADYISDGTFYDASDIKDGSAASSILEAENSAKDDAHIKEQNIFNRVSNASTETIDTNLHQPKEERDIETPTINGYKGRYENMDINKSIDVPEISIQETNGSSNNIDGINGNKSYSKINDKPESMSIKEERSINTSKLMKNMSNMDLNSSSDGDDYDIEENFEEITSALKENNKKQENRAMSIKAGLKQHLDNEKNASSNSIQIRKLESSSLKRVDLSTKTSTGLMADLARSNIPNSQSPDLNVVIPKSESRPNNESPNVEISNRNTSREQLINKQANENREISKNSTDDLLMSPRNPAESLQEAIIRQERDVIIGHIKKQKSEISSDNDSDQQNFGYRKDTFTANNNSTSSFRNVEKAQTNNEVVEIDLNDEPDFAPKPFVNKNLSSEKMSESSSVKDMYPKPKAQGVFNLKNVISDESGKYVETEHIPSVTPLPQDIIKQSQGKKVDVSLSEEEILNPQRVIDRHVESRNGHEMPNKNDNGISDNDDSFQFTPLNSQPIGTLQEKGGVLSSPIIVTNDNISHVHDIASAASEDEEESESESDDDYEEEDDFDIDAFDIENPDNTLSELLLYLEHQTVQVITTIQSLLSSIKQPKSTKGNLRSESNAINQVIGQMVGATSISMNQSRNANLKEHGSWVVQSLEDCSRRMLILCQLNKNGKFKKEVNDSDYADKNFKQRLAGIAFDIAKCTKELVKTVEEASLKEEIEYLNSKIH